MPAPYPGASRRGLADWRANLPRRYADGPPPTKGQVAALFVARKLAPHRRRSLPPGELHRDDLTFTGAIGLGGVVAATGCVAGSLPAPAPTPPLTYG